MLRCAAHKVWHVAAAPLRRAVVCCLRLVASFAKLPRLVGESVAKVMRGLRENGQLRFELALTGYAGSASFLRAVAGALAEVRRACALSPYNCAALS